MRSWFGWFFVGLAACTNVNTTPSPGGPPPGPTPVTTPTPVASEPTPPTATTPEAPPATAPAAVTVQMTAATLADDCGGPPSAAGKQKAARARMDRSCEQSSMQLSVTATAGGEASQIAVKKVELFDDKGTRIAELSARAPSVWDPSGAYQAWDQRVAPGQDLSVSYALSQPPWRDIPDRRARGYVLKAVLTVGGGEQAVQSDVQVAAATILPPNVKT